MGDGWSGRRGEKVEYESANISTLESSGKSGSYAEDLFVRVRMRMGG